MSAADTIRHVAWNGQVMTAGQRGELLIQSLDVRNCSPA